MGRLVLLIGLFSFWSATTFADTIRTFNVGNWYAGAYSLNGTNKFSHCAAIGSYRSGIKMLFSVDRKFTWSIGFANDRWALTRGSQYDIILKIDEYTPVSGKATAVSHEQVVVPAGDNVELFKLFRKGKELKVFAAGETFIFNLTDTGKMLASLLNCTNSYVNPAPLRSASINPFVTTSAPQVASGSKTSQTNNKAEAVTLLANVLAQSGLTDFYVFPPNEMPKDIKADVVWKADNVIGTFTVSPSMKLDELTSVLIGGDAQGCKGKFASGSLPDDTGAVRAFTACEKNAKTTTVYYVGIPRKAGGVYLMATADYGESQAAKKVDDNIRSAAMKVLYQSK